MQSHVVAPELAEGLFVSVFHTPCVKPLQQKACLDLFFIALVNLLLPMLKWGLFKRTAPRSYSGDVLYL